MTCALSASCIFWLIIALASRRCGPAVSVLTVWRGRSARPCGGPHPAAAGTSRSRLISPGWILVTGATGYVGGRARAPAARGRPPRPRAGPRPRPPGRATLGRTASRSSGATSSIPSTLPAGARGGGGRPTTSSTAWASTRPSPRATGDAARAFALAARDAGVRRIVYLGGLGDADGRPLRPPALPPGDRRGAAERRGSRHRVPRRGDRGQRQHLLRDDPLADRAAPGDDLPALGVPAHPAGGHLRRALLPRWPPRPSRRPPAGSWRSAAPTCSPTAT